MTCDGQSEYVKVGYLCDLFEPWARIEGSEWGDYMGALYNLISACESISFEDKMSVLCGWFIDELGCAIDDLYDRYEDSVWDAQDEYEHTTTYWRKRAVSFKGEAALEETIAELPAWIRPDPNRPAKADPELKEYDRLKAKFG